MDSKIQTSLGNHIKTVKGFAFKSDWYSESGTPVVKVSNFTNNSIDTIGLTRIPNKIASKHVKHELKPNDVVIQTVGSWPSNPQSVVGKVIKVPNSLVGALLNQNAVNIYPVNNLEKLYLYYLLKGSHFKEYIIGTAQGAASQASITLDAIKGYCFDLPSLKTQRKIATILSTYDDLIENNTRRIKTLEEMAQTIYREWFVNFRFPDHKKVKMVDSPLGKIPEGWEVKAVCEKYKTGSGGTPSRKQDDYYGGEFPWIKTRELNDGFVLEAEEKITELGLKKSSAKLFPEDTVIIAMYGATIGKLGILTQEAATNQACCALLPLAEPFGTAYIYWYLLNNRKELTSLGQGAAQQNISQIVIKKFEMLVPETTIVERFNQTADLALSKIKNLSLKNENLRQTRDLLLPKLISGVVDVSELDIEIGAE